MIEKRVHPRRTGNDGVFAVIDGNPFKIQNIGVGGASFYCEDMSFFEVQKQRLEILVMNGSIHYIKDIPHSLVVSSKKADQFFCSNNVQQVRVLFGDLSKHQSAQFRILLGLP